MLINFNDMEEIKISGMSGGSGEMSVRMFNDENYRIIPTIMHPGCSIGTHMQESGDDLNYIVSGIGEAVCDGVIEPLLPGTLHICPKNSEHSIKNTGETDLILLTIVVKK